MDFSVQFVTSFNFVKIIVILYVPASPQHVYKPNKYLSELPLFSYN